MNNNDKEFKDRLDSYWDELIKDSSETPGLIGRLVINRDDIFSVISEAQPAAESKTVFPTNKTQEATPMRSNTNIIEPERVSSSLEKNRLPPGTFVGSNDNWQTAGSRRNKKFTSKKKKVGGGKKKTKTKGEKMNLNTFRSRTPNSVISNGGISLFTELSSSAYASHKTIFEHYFKKFFWATVDRHFLEEFCVALEDKINERLPGGLRITAIAKPKQDLCVIEFFKTKTPTPKLLFHFSLHRLNSGIPGFLGLVHLVSDETSATHKWKQNVRLKLNIGTVVNDSEQFVKLFVDSSHNPKENGTVKIPKNPRTNSHPRTLIMKIGVVVAEVFKAYVESVSLLKVINEPREARGGPEGGPRGPGGGPGGGAGAAGVTAGGAARGPRGAARGPRGAARGPRGGPRGGGANSHKLESNKMPGGTKKK
jgi:hypothetical protein